ncbi:hypothetical protein D3C87_1630940 [compost metagenome]
MLLTHLEREKEYGLFCHGGDVVGKVCYEGSLTHCRTCGKDNEVRSLKSGGHVVKVSVAGTNTTNRSPVTVEFFHTIEAVGKNSFDTDKVLFEGLVAHAKEFSFGSFK